jgi:glyoxalase family protein
MPASINGLHHVTAISGGAQRNLDFYVKILGLRFVKKTVNFDDPGVYHLYYGDEVGSPGTALTFFPWEHLSKGRAGVGEASLTQFSVPPGSLPFWQRRLETAGVKASGAETCFGEKRLLLEDPDGMRLALVVPEEADERAPWLSGKIGEDAAIRGFHGVTLTLASGGPTAELLTGVMGYELVEREGERSRYASPSAAHARFVDILEQPQGAQALQGGGSVHHIAFSVEDRAAQSAVRERLLAAGHTATPQIDRNYFFSIYFRSPGGVLFEIATEEPGFTVDEPVAELGRNLKLPAQHEHLRTEIERTLPPLRL